MTKYEIMESLTNQYNGYLLTAAVQEAGISRTYLARYVKEQRMERVETGIYIRPDTQQDSLYILQLKNKETIFSYETALYLHGLIKEQPSRICVSVKRGYNATHLINRGIKPYFVRQELFEQGVAILKTAHDNKVRVYDIDRTICDMVQRKDEMDIYVFQDAIRNYLSGNRKDLHRLMMYAKLLGNEQKIKTYTELVL